MSRHFRTLDSSLYSYKYLFWEGSLPKIWFSPVLQLLESDNAVFNAVCIGLIYENSTASNLWVE